MGKSGGGVRGRFSRARGIAGRIPGQRGRGESGRNSPGDSARLRARGDQAGGGGARGLRREPGASISVTWVTFLKLLLPAGRWASPAVSGAPIDRPAALRAEVAVAHPGCSAMLFP